MFTPMVSPPADAARALRWFLVRHGDLLVDESGAVPTGREDPRHERGEQPVFLGALDGVACWAAGVPAGAPAPEGFQWVPLRALGSRWDPERWAVAGRAVQLVEWRRTHRFCGRCATATVLVEGERVLRCPACGLSSWPRLAPAVIVLVRRGEQALLAQGSRFRGRMFSTLAGFVEPGETLEEAVRREVAEEVGVRLGHVRYFGSQPWPFPHSLMVGFTAEWAAGDICVDGEEIVDAGWFDASALPPIPPPMSIARRLIDAWVAEVGGQHQGGDSSL